MQSIIKQDRTVIGRQVKNIEETIQKHLKKSPEILDPTTILNALGTKWSEKVSAKKKEIDSYLRYLHQIEGSFRAIQHATGIADINQFVTIFLKSEDQQHSLYMYVDSLNSEIDSLEEDIRHLKDAIAKCTKDKEVGNVTADNDLTDIQEKITKAEIKLESKLNNLEKVKYQLKAIEKPLDHIINQFEESELELKVASPVKVNEHTQQDDLMPLIASCEEYINTLETYLAYKNKEKLAAVKVVPHDQMKAKDFEKVPITIKDILEMGGLLEDEEVEEAKTPLSRKRIRDIAKVITDQ